MAEVMEPVEQLPETQRVFCSTWVVSASITA
jgi:hypothetical protein